MSFHCDLTVGGRSLTWCEIPDLWLRRLDKTMDHPRVAEKKNAAGLVLSVCFLLAQISFFFSWLIIKVSVLTLVHKQSQYIATYGRLEAQGPCAGHRSIIAILHCFSLVH